MIIITKKYALIQYIPKKYMLLDIIITENHVLMCINFLLHHNVVTLKEKLLFLKHKNIMA